jgi:DNA-binding LytR/AlgR family response regulator
MNCLIIDDDDIQLALLSDYIADTGFLELAGACKRAEDAFPILADKPIELIFLDVEMPKMNGFAFLKTLNPPPQIIIISSHKKYAVEAFDMEVADFLVKPITYERFIKAVNRVKKNIESKTSVYAAKDVIFVREGTDIINIPLKDILWIEAEGDYINIHLSNTQHLVLTSLNEMEQKLSSLNFARVHRSYIVNTDKIKKISGDMLIVNEKLIPISRTYKPKLLRKIEVV